MEKHNKFTIDNRTFKQVKSDTGCINCAGSFSDEICLKISNYVSERDYRSCQQGFIFVEVEK